MTTLTEQAQIDFRTYKGYKSHYPPDELIRSLINKGFEKYLEEYEESWYTEWCNDFDSKQKIK